MYFAVTVRDFNLGLDLGTENFQLINLSRDQLRALTVLSYSDNEELQRTAAFFFSEISEQCECIRVRGQSSNAIFRHAGSERSHP